MRRVSKAKAAALAERGKAKQSKRASGAASKSRVDSDADDECELSLAEMKEKAVKKNQPKHDNGNASDEEEAYEVEFILGSRLKHGKQQFKIRWKGFGPADDTWEDEENIDSPDLIAAYLKETQKDSKDGEKTPKNSKQAKSDKKKAQKRSGSSTSKETPKKQKAEDGADGNCEWEVSKIIEHVELKDGTRQFLVRWKGYSAKDDTWEPEAHLNCPDLIEKFLAKEGQKEELTRETREVRKQVHKYNPALAKRSSHRFRVKSSDFGSLDDSCQQNEDSSPHYFTLYGSRISQSNQREKFDKSSITNWYQKCSVM